jgi:hypothetical protein
MVSTKNMYRLTNIKNLLKIYMFISNILFYLNKINNIHIHIVILIINKINIVNKIINMIDN